jgi:DNA-binding MarR family transcriptional regulator
MMKSVNKAVAMKGANTHEQAKTFVSLLIEVWRQVFLPDDGQVSELPVAQLRVCGTLFRGPRPMSALSRELGVSLSAMTQIADRLERAHLVQRVATGSDRRIKCLQLTPRGEKIMRIREDVRAQRAAAMLEHLPPTVREGALESLQRFAGACAEMKQRGVAHGDD